MNGVMTTTKAEHYMRTEFRLNGAMIEPSDDLRVRAHRVLMAGTPRRTDTSGPGWRCEHGRTYIDVVEGVLELRQVSMPPTRAHLLAERIRLEAARLELVRELRSIDAQLAQV